MLIHGGIKKYLLLLKEIAESHCHLFRRSLQYKQMNLGKDLGRGTRMNLPNFKKRNGIEDQR